MLPFAIQRIIVVGVYVLISSMGSIEITELILLGLLNSVLWFYTIPYLLLPIFC